MKNTTRFLIVILLLPCLVFAGDSTALSKRLAYLKDMPEVSWVEVNNNSVFIGFKTLPRDLKSIVSAAAIHGNRAADFGVHIWAVPESQKNFRPGLDPSYCTATARHGKIESNSCR